MVVDWTILPSLEPLNTVKETISEAGVEISLIELVCDIWLA